MTNNTSPPSVEKDVSSRDKLSTGFLGEINGCSIGTMTVKFSGCFWNVKESVDTTWFFINYKHAAFFLLVCRAIDNKATYFIVNATLLYYVPPPLIDQTSSPLE